MYIVNLLRWLNSQSSTVQTEGEIVTVKPKRYSQRSKNVDPNALREKVRETMSLEGKFLCLLSKLVYVDSVFVQT